ncbi:MAG: DUF885 family protein [Clostridia bacterium]|nr:DUF885 family protein [Clostridia bacterium]
MSRRLCCIIIATALLLSCFGCSTGEGNAADSGATFDPPKAGESASGETNAPSTTFAEDWGQVLADLDEEIFYWYASRNYRAFAEIKPRIGDLADRIEARITLGSFSADSALEEIAAIEGFLGRLNEIDRDRLSDSERYSCETIERGLVNLLQERESFAYSEPLTPYAGEHIELLLFLLTFDIESVEDAQIYLKLMAELPAYMDQLIAHEINRAEAGLFMTERALVAVLNDLEAIISGFEAASLRPAFELKIRSIEGISSETANGLLSEHEILLQTAYLPAYTALYDALQLLLPYCREELGLTTAFGTEGGELFELMVRENGASGLSVAEARELLENGLQDIQLFFALLYGEDPELFAMEINTSVATFDEAEAYMTGIMEGVVPSIAMPEYEVYSFPHELEHLQIPMLYRGGAVICAEGGELSLFDFARTVYPGEAYLNAFNAEEAKASFLNCLPPEGYEEGWALYSELLFASNAGEYGVDYCQFRFLDSMYNTLLLASSSIMVNYYGYSEAALADYLEGYQMRQFAESYYQTVTAMPDYHLASALGYCNVLAIFELDESETYEEAQGFVEDFLKLGTGYFDIISQELQRKYG